VQGYERRMRRQHVNCRLKTQGLKTPVRVVPLQAVLSSTGLQQVEVVALDAQEPFVARPVV
jgi:hypothetical protein